MVHSTYFIRHYISIRNISLGGGGGELKIKPEVLSNTQPDYIIQEMLNNELYCGCFVISGYGR